MTRTPDVIVIGAGAAGLSTAQSLQSGGLSAVVLEAAGHIGGRCVTDHSSFSMPFDMGGSWLHSGPINPLAPLAEQAGLALHKSPGTWHWVHSNGKRLSDSDVLDYRAYHADMWQAVGTAGRQTPDLATEFALPDSPFRDTAKHWVAQMQGGDPAHVSCADVHNYADADGDWLVEGGLGAFIARLHADVDVRLNSPVSAIDTTGPRVRVTTSQGVVEAPDVVVTVSTGVLAAEAIAFTPALPDSKTGAISSLPNGLLNKVGIEFDPSWTQAHQGQMADYHTGPDAFCTLLFGFYGSGLAVGFVAGACADRLEREGPDAATDYCLDGIKSVFGSDALKYIRRTKQTAWRSNPLSLGSYSYALPGCADARAALAAPIDEKLYFAGEATMADSYSTVHGAYLSGKAAADQIILKRKGASRG